MNRQENRLVFTPGENGISVDCFNGDFRDFTILQHLDDAAEIQYTLIPYPRDEEEFEDIGECGGTYDIIIKEKEMPEASANLGFLFSLQEDASED